MKNVWVALVSGIALGALIVWGVGRFKPEHLTSSQESPSHSDTPGSVHLQPGQQSRAGIVVAPLESRELAREIKGYGRVIDAQPMLDLLTELRSAQAALEVSSKEYERMRALHANDQNASTRALEAALATMTRDRIQADAARNKLLGAWGRAIIERADLQRIAQSLTTLQAVLIRVDLPPSDALAAAPASAHIFSPLDPTRSAEARSLGLAMTAQTQTPGQGFMFLLQPNALELRPDMGVVALLEVTGTPLYGVVVPRSAIVRHEGRTWIYEQQDEQTFTRVPITLSRAIDSGWFVGADAVHSKPVVIGGAQALLSEELKSQIELAD